LVQESLLQLLKGRKLPNPYLENISPVSLVLVFEPLIEHGLVVPFCIPLSDSSLNPALCQMSAGAGRKG